MRLQTAVLISAVCAIAYLGWVYASRHTGERAGDRKHELEDTRRAAEFERVYGGTAVKILQFYSPAATVMEGESATICYGVLNAISVRMDPPVDSVSPAISRCLAVSPEEDTRYTVIAEGRDGRIVSESFLLRVTPDPATTPEITAFRIANHKIDRNVHVFLLTFTARNAEQVEIDPPVFLPLHGAPQGRFYVTPARTTTYTLTAVGKRGRKVRKELTVTVPAG